MPIGASSGSHYIWFKKIKSCVFKHRIGLYKQCRFVSSFYIEKVYRISPIFVPIFLVIWLGTIK